jgi:hypothetical protein
MVKYACFSFSRPLGIADIQSIELVLRGPSGRFLP